MFRQFVDQIWSTFVDSPQHAPTGPQSIIPLEKQDYARLHKVGFDPEVQYGLVLIIPEEEEEVAEEAPVEVLRAMQKSRALQHPKGLEFKPPKGPSSYTVMPLTTQDLERLRNVGFDPSRYVLVVLPEEQDQVSVLRKSSELDLLRGTKQISRSNFVVKRKFPEISRSSLAEEDESVESGDDGEDSLSHDDDQGHQSEVMFTTPLAKARSRPKVCEISPSDKIMIIDPSMTQRHRKAKRVAHSRHHKSSRTFAGQVKDWIQDDTDYSVILKNLKQEEFASKLWTRWTPCHRLHHHHSIQESTPAAPSSIWSRRATAQS